MTMIFFRYKIVFGLFFLCFVSLFSTSATAQETSFNYIYKLNMGDADTPPQVGNFDINFPEAARKNGVEGTVKATLTLGENGKTRDILISENLPFGVSEAVNKGLQNFYFQPAKKNGQPIAVTMLFDFIVTAVYDEMDKNVNKAKVIEKPAPVYPPKYAAEKLKDKVQVKVLVFADGKHKILGVSSVMPKEFDRAAIAAAANLKFQPAVHKKSKKPVAQKTTVEFEFKP